MVVYHLVYDPARCASAHDKDYVAAEICPSVPEVFKGTDKSRTSRVHPRHFVYEYDLFPPGQSIKEFLQCMECSRPIAESERPAVRSCFKRVAELRQLLLHALVGKPSMHKGKRISKRLLHKICLAYAPPPENGNEF